MSGAMLSFDYVTPALVAGHVCMARRRWLSADGARFRRHREVLAYDRSPADFDPLWPVARLRLVDDARWEPDAHATDADWTAEGYRFMRVLWEAYVAKVYRGVPVPPSVPLPPVWRPHVYSWWEQGRREGRGHYDLTAYRAWRGRGGSSWVIRFEVIELLRGIVA